MARSVVLAKKIKETIKWVETGTRGVALKQMDIVLTQPGKSAWGIGRPHFRHSGVFVSGAADQMATFSANNTEFPAEFRNNIIFNLINRTGFSLPLPPAALSHSSRRKSGCDGSSMGFPIPAVCCESSPAAPIPMGTPPARWSIESRFRAPILLRELPAMGSPQQISKINL
jgi:hypothetical protein